MPLASGADVGIGAYEFMLATDDDDEGYEWMLENLYGDEAEIEGTEGKKTANKNILFWGYDNWIGGDGLRYWDPDQKERWWSGNANPRIPGAITATPTRSQATTITTAGSPPQAFFSIASGRVWYLADEGGWYSTDGTTWTENTDVATELPANYNITAVASDGDKVYIAASDGSSNAIWTVDSDSAVSDFWNGSSSFNSVTAMAIRDQYLYAWTGAWLLRFDTQAATIPITATHTQAAVFKPRALGGGASASSDMVTADNTVVFMRSTVGETTLFEYKLDPSTNKLAGRTFWNMPTGFTGRKLCYSSGIIYVIGDYNDKVGLWGYSNVNRQPLFLGYVGEANSVNSVRCMAPSYGAQILLGVENGTSAYVYVYDAEEDAFSQLDERTIAADGTLHAVITYKNRRLSAAAATTSSKINRWILDTDTPAGTWEWTSSAHDFGYPQDEKVLLGFHVVADPSIAAGTIDLDYQIDETGTWVDSGTDTAAGSKHTYMTISDGSSTVKFRTLRFRMNGSSGARCFSVYARAYINSKQEVWRLKLDLRNEPGTTRKPSNRASAALKLRDNLRTLATAGNVVTFKDGTRKRRKSSTADTGYTSHTVLVEFPKSSVDSGREGTCEVILRSVAPSA
jgi:hypothetical protein